MTNSIKLLLVCETDEQAAAVQGQLTGAGFSIELETVDHQAATMPLFGAGNWDATCIFAGADETTDTAALYGIRHRSPRTRCIVIDEQGAGPAALHHEVAGGCSYTRLSQLAALPETLRHMLSAAGARQGPAATDLACCPDFLSNVLTTVPHEIVVRDADSRIIFANEAITRFHDCRPADLTGLRDADIWRMNGRPLEQVTDWLAQDRQVIETGQTLEYVQEIRRDNGDTVYYHNIKKAIIHDDGTRYLLAMYTDITEQQQSEAKLSQARAEAAELAGIHKITATYAHEINNPLTGILGIVQLLLDDGIDNEATLEMLTEVQSAAYRIKDVILKLQTLHNPQTRPYLGHSEMIDLHGEG